MLDNFILYIIIYLIILFKTKNKNFFLCKVFMIINIFIFKTYLFCCRKHNRPDQSQFLLRIHVFLINKIKLPTKSKVDGIFKL